MLRNPPGERSKQELGDLPRKKALLDATEPVFSPIVVNGARTKRVIVRSASDAIKDDARRFHEHDLSSFFVDDLVNAFEHTESTAAIAQHFGIEQKPAISVALIERGENLFSRLYLHTIPGLEA